MNEAIVTKALENLRARVAELETDRDAALAEVERLRAELAEARDTIADPATGYIARLAKTKVELNEAREQVARVRARHWQQCSGACGLDDACECEDRDLLCGECNDQWPCGTIRDLDGTETS